MGSPSHVEPECSFELARSSPSRAPFTPVAHGGRYGVVSLVSESDLPAFDNITPFKGSPSLPPSPLVEPECSFEPELPSFSTFAVITDVFIPCDGLFKGVNLSTDAPVLLSTGSDGIFGHISPIVGTQPNIQDATQPNIQGVTQPNIQDAPRSSPAFVTPQRRTGIGTGFTPSESARLSSILSEPEDDHTDNNGTDNNGTANDGTASDVSLSSAAASVIQARFRVYRSKRRVRNAVITRVLRSLRKRKLRLLRRASAASTIQLHVRQWMATCQERKERNEQNLPLSYALSTPISTLTLQSALEKLRVSDAESQALLAAILPPVQPPPHLHAHTHAQTMTAQRRVCFDSLSSTDIVVTDSSDRREATYSLSPTASADLPRSATLPSPAWPRRSSSPISREDIDDGCLEPGPELELFATTWPSRDNEPHDERKAEQEAITSDTDDHGHDDASAPIAYIENVQRTLVHERDDSYVAAQQRFSIRSDFAHAVEQPHSYDASRLVSAIASDHGNDHGSDNDAHDSYNFDYSDSYDHGNYSSDDHNNYDDAEVHCSSFNNYNCDY